mgnify:CR=1 FL=1
MSLLPSLAVLDAPALFVAGLASSAHCALMCGALHTRVARSPDWSLHAGRVTAYGLVGAIAGGAGFLLLRSLAWLPFAEGLRLLMLPLAVWMLLRSQRRLKRAPCCVTPSTALIGDGAGSSFMRGLLMGLVPCALLYAAASLALLSGSAARGAVLLMAFGLGTVPAVQAGAWMWMRARSPAMSQPARRAVMVAAACASVLMVVATLNGTAAAAWCLGLAGGSSTQMTQVNAGP